MFNLEETSSATWCSLCARYGTDEREKPRTTTITLGVTTLFLATLACDKIATPPIKAWDEGVE